MLPLSRNETHDNTTTIKPTTIDDIQDCIIGAKHPSRIVWGVPVVPSVQAPSCVVPMSGSEPTGDAYWVFDASLNHRLVLSFPTILPGTSIPRMIVRANSAGAGKLLSTKLWFRSGVSAAVQKSSGLDHSGVNGDVSDSDPSRIVGADDRVYAIVTGLNSVFSVLYGVGLEIERL